jgi:hypothetical protein
MIADYSARLEKDEAESAKWARAVLQAGLAIGDAERAT